jgi:two-component system response regulator RegA
MLGGGNRGTVASPHLGVGRIGTILVVDDDERVLAGFARSLGMRRTVFTATSCFAASAIARRERLDLAIVDMRLGSDSGLDVVRVLKVETPNTVVAIVSGYLSIDTTVLAVRAGADVIMTKPITGRDIMRRIEGGECDEPDPDPTPTLARAESEHIARVMADCEGNVSEAARRLGIYRSSLQRKLRKLSSDS